MECRRAPLLRAINNNVSMVTPDGVPVMAPAIDRQKHARNGSMDPT
jgi:hypothetical protein